MLVKISQIKKRQILEIIIHLWDIGREIKEINGTEW